MRISDRTPMQTMSASTNQPKRLGGYLIEAGLITTSQVEVALNDQQATGMRFGEILVARGWVKEQTIEYLMKKIVLPERKASKRPATPPSQDTVPQHQTQIQSNSREDGKPERSTPGVANKGERKLAWGELPVYNPKASPVATSPGEDIDWVG